MKLSVIVTNYKTPELLKLCLKSVKSAAGNLEHKIIVLDSEVEDEESGQIKEEFNEIKYFPFKKNVGYAKLINNGLKEAEGEYILIINADIILEKDALEKMIEYLERHPETGILGPKLLNFNGSVQDSCFRFYKFSTIFSRRTIWGKTPWGKKELEYFLMKDFNHQEIREVDWLLGASLMVRRKAFQEVGPMDERFFLYFEDVDWCRRFKEKGWKLLYFPPARMNHYHGRQSKKSGGIRDLFFNKYAWIHISSALKYFWKYRKN